MVFAIKKYCKKNYKVQSYQGTCNIQENDWQERWLFFSMKTARKIQNLNQVKRALLTKNYING